MEKKGELLRKILSLSGDELDMFVGQLREEGLFSEEALADFSKLDGAQP